MVTNYTDRKRKLEVQKEIYSTITKKTFVGLCGPNIIEYLNKIDYKRFHKITLYEINKSLYNKLKVDLGDNYPTVKLINDSINKHLGKTKAFYDLDYCKSFEDIRAFMPKIAKIEEFSITISYRPYGFSFGAFAAYLGHSAYKHFGYRDGNPMLTILINKKLYN
jgi:hypothetical protein